MTSDECGVLIDCQDAGTYLYLYINIYTKDQKMIRTQQPFVSMLIIAFGDHIDGFDGAKFKMSESLCKTYPPWN